MRPKEQLLLDPCKLVSLVHDPVIYLFQQPGHRYEHLRLYLLQIVPDGIHALGIVDGTVVEQIDIGQHPLVNMIQRQKTERPDLTLWQTGGAGLYIADDIPMGKHDALWRPGGARSIDDGRQVLLPDRILDLLQSRGFLRRWRDQQLGPVTHARHGFDGKDLFQTRNLIADLQYFMIEFLVIDKNEPHLGVVQDKLQLVGSDSGINGCKYRAGALYGEIEHDPFGPVLTNDADLLHPFGCPVTAGNPQPQKPGA